MPKRNKVEKIITVAKHKFRLEVYLSLDGHKDICWEIFPHSHDAALYAFSNKNKLTKLIESKHIYEPKP
tara:strand:+ start:360 stop:566 length:207 start_codon:yes stop_codon:yes gene_type:complete